jgi:Peptidase family M28/PA domain
MATVNKAAVKHAKSISPEDLKKHLYIVAGKEMEGRETGTEGQRKAAAYIEAYFKKLGLQPGAGNSYQQYYPLQQDSLVSAAINVNGASFPLNEDFQPSVAGNTNGSISAAEVVFAGYGIADPAYNDYKNIDVNGKVVLIAEGEPKLNDSIYQISGSKRRSEWSFGLNKKIQAAIKQGAQALLVINRNFPRTAAPPRRSRMYVNFKQEKNINVFFVSENIAGALINGESFAAMRDAWREQRSLIAASYSAKLRLDFEKFNFNLQASNVLGYLPGTDKQDELIVISAHYDHLGKKDTVIWYGADDDGSGTVGLLELAEAFAKAKAAGNGPRRSILFLAVSGEEKGLWGSEYYTLNPSYPLEKTVTDLNIDMIGRVDKEHEKNQNYVYIIGDDKLSSELRPISEDANRLYTQLSLDYKYNDPNDPNRFYYRSDHYNFAEKKIPIIFYFNGVHKDYHQPSDTPDKIDYKLLAKRVQLVFHTAWQIAQREERPKVDSDKK